MPLFNLFRKKPDKQPSEKQETAQPQPPQIRYEGENFKMVEGFDDVKVVLERAMEMQRRTVLTGGDYRLHVLLAGPPGIAKTMLLMSVEKEIPAENRVFLLGSQLSKAGLRNKLIEAGDKIQYVLIDELDKMGEKTDYDVLLSLMQTGRISVLKASIEADVTCMATVFATANYLEKIPPELLDRFMILYLPQYQPEDFMKVAVRMLREYGMNELDARSIAATMWRMGFRSARDVLRVARYSMGDTRQALVCLQIMASRAPPRR
ncbi:MAG: AAA family ATPase [Candidatus Caldarchaeum sp.]